MLHNDLESKEQKEENALYFSIENNIRVKLREIFPEKYTDEYSKMAIFSSSYSLIKSSIKSRLEKLGSFSEEYSKMAIFSQPVPDLTVDKSTFLLADKAKGDSTSSIDTLRLGLEKLYPDKYKREYSRMRIFSACNSATSETPVAKSLETRQGAAALPLEAHDLGNVPNNSLHK